MFVNKTVINTRRTNSDGIIRAQPLRSRCALFKLLSFFGCFAIAAHLFTGGLASAQSSRLEAFGVFSPVMGIQEAIPAVTIPEVFTTDNENVVLKYGEIHRCRMRRDSMTNAAPDAMPDGNPVLRYHWLEKSDGTDYLYAFTATHAYWRNTGTDAWDVKFTSGGTATAWSTVSFCDTLYATNNVDKVQYTEGSGAFAVLDEAGGLDIDDNNTYLTKARFVTAFEGYLVVGNVTVGGGNYPTAIYWSDTQDPTDWGSGNAGSLILPGPDFLVGSGQIADFLLIFGGRTIDQVWATESTLIFNARRLRNNIGTNAPDSILNGPSGELYFMDNRKNLRVVRSPMSDMEIVSRSIEPSVKQIPDSLVSGVRSCWIDSLEQIWWALPYGPEATANNRIFCRDAYGAWTKRAIPVSAFGEYEVKTTYTWSTLPYSTWTTWDWEKWWTVEVLAEAHLDLCGDYSGYTYESHYTDTDSADAFTGYAVIETDFSQVKGTPLVDRYKRLVFLTTIFRNEGSGTATVSLKRDFEYAWQTVDTVDLDGTTDYIWTKHQADYRARHYSIKISGANRYRFVGCIFYYVPEALR